MLLAAVGTAVWRVMLGYPDPGRRYQALNRAEVAFIARAADAMYPPGGAIPSSGVDADLPGYIDRFMVASKRPIRLLLHLLFFLVEHATLLFPAPGWNGMRRFSALDSEQRVAALDGWYASNLFARRLVFTSLRALLTMGFFAHPPVVRSLALAPFAIETPVCEADLLYPRVGEHPDTIRYRREDLTESRPAVPIALDAPIHPAFVEPGS